MRTRPHLTISTLAALASPSSEPGEGSNELFSALSIASARFDAIGDDLDRLRAQLSSTEPPRRSESSATQLTT